MAHRTHTLKYTLQAALKAARQHVHSALNLPHDAELLVPHHGKLGIIKIEIRDLYLDECPNCPEKVRRLERKTRKNNVRNRFLYLKSGTHRRKLGHLSVQPLDLLAGRRRLVGRLEVLSEPHQLKLARRVL